MMVFCLASFLRGDERAREDTQHVSFYTKQMVGDDVEENEAQATMIKGYGLQISESNYWNSEREDLNTVYLSEQEAFKLYQMLKDYFEPKES